MKGNRRNREGYFLLVTNANPINIKPGNPTVGELWNLLAVAIVILFTTARPYALRTSRQSCRSLTNQSCLARLTTVKLYSTEGYLCLR
jgi:hypothetical protein